MNNDIKGINNYTNAKSYINHISPQAINIKNQNEREISEFSMNALDSLGKAKVKLDNCTISASIDKFIADSHKVEYYNTFCEGLVNRGYPLETAINKTELVFRALKEKTIYN